MFSSACKKIARVTLLYFLWLGVAVVSPAQEQVSIPLELRKSDRLLSIHADSQEKDKNIAILRGHVEVAYRGMKLTADEVTYDETSGEITGKGNVLFVDPRSHIAADEVHYNIRTEQGWFTNPHGFVHSAARPRPRVLYTPNPFYLQGKKAERLDEDTYTLEDGRVTVCSCERQGWSLSSANLKIVLDDKAMARGTIVRFLGIPCFYLPYAVMSIERRPRRTGFLLPHVGSSTIKGNIIGAGFFWAISPSVDLLLGLEYYTLRGLAPRVQFHAMPSENTKLTMDYFQVIDRDKVLAKRAPGESLKMIGDTTDLPYGFRGVADVDYVSSLDFRETYSPTFTEAVNSEAHQNGFVTKEFDAYDFNVYASRYEDFLSAERVPGNAIIIRETPQFSFLGMDKQEGESPLYFSFQTSAGEVGRTEPGLPLPSLSERLDLHPEMTLRLPEFLGFHLTPSAGVDAARYGISLNPNREPISRLMGDFSLDLRPPSFEKVFAWSLRHRRLKHVIEPDIVYRLVKARDPEELAEVVRFDDLDILSQTNEVEYSITNTLFARKDAADGTKDKPQAQELVSFRIAQKYYWDPTFGGVLGPGNPIVWEPTLSLTGFHFIPGRRMSPVISDLKIAPFSHYDTELKLDLSPYGGGIIDAGVTSHLKRGAYGLAFTDYYINKNTYLNQVSGNSVSPPPTTASTLTTSYHLLNLLATYGDVNRKGLSGAAGVDYNLVQKTVASDVVQTSYNFGCFGLNFEYQHYALPTRRETLFRFAISLANVGTFGDFKPRDRLY